MGATESHGESLAEKNVRLPLPVFVTLREDALGFVLLPCVPLKDNAGGDTDRFGVEGLTAKLIEFELPPGDCTLTAADPAEAIKLAGTVAVSCVVEPNVVASAEPFHNTVSPDTKFVPVTASVKLELPAMALAGDTELTVGVGGGRAGDTVMVTVRTPGEPCAPGAVTVTWPV